MKTLKCESFLFWKRFAVVMSGTAIAQVISFAVTPILTRMLTPDVLGPYFIWLGVASVISIFLSLRLDIAVFNANTHKQLLSIIQSAVVMAVMLAVILWAVVLGIKTAAPTFIALLKLDWWYEEAIVLGSIWAINMVVQSAYIYDGHFKRQAVFKITLAFAVAFSQISAILLGCGVKGIINFQILVTAIILLINIIDISNLYKFNLCNFSSVELFATLKSHWRFPVLSMPADFLSATTAQLPSFLFGHRYGEGVAGEYALMNKSVAVPSKLIAGSILSVFKVEASRQYREYGECKKAYIDSFKRLALVGIAPFGGLYLFSECLFGVFFGNEWRQSGVLASIMAPMFYVQFIASPLSYTLFLARKNLQDLFWQILYFTCIAVILFRVDDAKDTIKLISVICSMLYLINIYLSFRAAKGLK